MKTILTALIILTGLSQTSFAQDRDNYMKSSDGEFVMELNREHSQVGIVLFLADAKKYESVNIERSFDPIYSFSRCKYVDMNEADVYEGALLVADNYPAPISESVYYRIRAVTKEGAELVYPSVALKTIVQ